MQHRVEAELVANVIKVNIQLGDRVTIGDELVLLESMKMEIPVLSEWSGTIDHLGVSPGDVVSEGDLIALVESDSQH